MNRRPVVVITGGSSGIGAAFATRYAKEGAGLVLVARSAPRLDAVASRLREGHGVPVQVIAQDLSVPGAGAAVRDQVRALGLTADVVVNNAGFATYGRFDAQPMEAMREEIALNVAGLVEVSHAFLPDLLERRGALIHVASTAGFQPVPYMAVYGATKAFVLSFSEALWAEYRTRGLRVLALCPGATETPFFERVGAAEASLGKRSSPEAVVDAAFRALRRHASVVVPGAGNAVSSALPRLLPRATTARVVERMMRPRQAAALPAAPSAGQPRRSE